MVNLMVKIYTTPVIYTQLHKKHLYILKFLNKLKIIGEFFVLKLKLGGF